MKRSISAGGQPASASRRRAWAEMIRDFECHEPVHVRPSPSFLARIMQAKPQKECGDVLALGPVVFGRRIAGSHEIPHRLMTLVWHPDRSQLACPEKLRKIDSIAPIGLHPVAGLRWNQR